MSSMDVRRELSLHLYIGMPWKAILIWPSFGARLNMLGPKGLKIASLYFLIIVTAGFSMRVREKFEESGDHHFPVRMVIGGVASPTACQRHALMALIIV